MPSTLVREVFFRVSAGLHDLNSQFLRWTQREFIGFYNDACKAVAKYVPSSSARVDAWKLAPGSKQSIELIGADNIIPGDGSEAAEVRGIFLQSLIRNMGATGQVAGRAIRIVDREILDVNAPNWHTETGTPISSYVFDPRYPKVFYVFPAVPADEDWWVEGSMLADPIPLAVPVSPTHYAADGAATQTIAIDDRYVDEIVNYMLARAYMKDAEYAGNTQQAQVHTALFANSINAMAAALTGVNPNLRSLPFSPNVPKAQPAG